MRWMTNYEPRHHVKITELREKIKLTPIVHILKERKFKWFGHLKSADNLAKVIFEGCTEGKRKKGRPKI